MKLSGGEKRRISIVRALYGKIIETGSHEKPLLQKGLYYAMWRQQVGERREMIDF